MIEHALAVLLALGASDRLDEDDLLRAAEDVVLACLQPQATAAEIVQTPLDCIEVTVVLWRMETRFNLRSMSTRHGCGVLQVNISKSMRHKMPTCHQLRDTPRLSFAWGVRIFRRKLYAAKGSVLRAFMYYNGTERQGIYGRYAYGLLRRINPERWRR